MRSCTANSSVANRINSGTRRSKSAAGVMRSSIAPASVPITLGTISQYMRGCVWRSSRR